MRCQRKVELSDCSWNAGLLVCHQYGCYDRNVNGAFEMEEAKQASTDKQELVPDPKLIHPNDILEDLNHISASAGEY